MEEKIKDTVNNICTILGGALLLYPIIEQATKTLTPELQKLTGGEYEKELALLTDGKESSEYKKEPEYSHAEIEELKKKLAEYESKEKQQ